MIRAGTVSELRRNSGEWLFVDIGFAQSARSCGFFLNDDTPLELTFADLITRGRRVVADSDRPLNFLIEAPLPVAFTAVGNPTGRACEKRNGQTRYWYVGLGCGVLMATLYFLRGIAEVAPQREVRLFEGFASLKDKGSTSSHATDVLMLQEVVWYPDRYPNAIVTPDRLAAFSGSK